MNSRIGIALVCALASVPLARAGDVNGDGYDDLVVCAGGEDVDGTDDAGAVSVLFGSAGGITADGAQWLSLADIPGTTLVKGAYFGEEIALGDFDGDGYDDAAIAAPGYPVNKLAYAGVVFVLRGSATGLRTQGAKRWSQASAGIADKPEPTPGSKTQSHERFGSSLVAADFDGDGCEDLAIGVHESFTKANERSGAVHVLYGSKKGLRAKRNKLLHLDAPGVPGCNGLVDVLGSLKQVRFGRWLAAGDVNGDGTDDLVASSTAPADIDTMCAAYVFFGSKHGVSGASVQVVPVDGDGATANEWLDEPFVAVGNFDGDAFDDVVLSTHGATVDGFFAAGLVHVMRGSANGVDAGSHVAWSRATTGILGDPASQAYFASRVATGDFDLDGRDDFAAAAPGATVNGATFAGDVSLVHGGPALFAVADNKILSQATLGVFGDPESGDEFGFAMTTGDYDGDGYADIAIGALGESIGAIPMAGIVHVFYGGAAGLALSAGQHFDGADVAASTGLEPYACFGSAFGR